MPPNVQFFARFTSSSAFRYSVIFIVRLKKSQTTPLLPGSSSFLRLSFRDFGCGKATHFDGLFRKNLPSDLLSSMSGKNGESWRFSRGGSPVMPAQAVLLPGINNFVTSPQ